MPNRQVEDVDRDDLSSDRWLESVSAELWRSYRRSLRSYPQSLVREVLFDGDTPRLAARFLAERGDA